MWLRKKERKKDLTSLLNQRFGRLVVIERDLSKPTGHQKESYWKCKCDCGKEVSVLKRQLTSGKTKSCGCYRSDLVAQKNILDLTNKKYGKLTALENTYKLSEHHSYIWKCQCECGEICYYPAEVLQLGRTNSCGCGIRSKGELKIASLLKENGVTFSQEISFSDFKNPETNHPYRFDFAILKAGQIDFLIEFDGEQHFKEVSLFRDNLKTIQEKDIIKNNYCFTHNISLKRIPYWELETLSFNDLMSDKFLVREEN